jgi:hypothetical protein
MGMVINILLALAGLIAVVLVALVVVRVINDRYVIRTWRSLGVEKKVVNVTGPELSRSALGCLLAESILVPSARLPQWGVTWAAEDDNHISAIPVAVAKRPL